ncbi:hypothetical protein AAZX31_08G080700 [Glycine max]
MKPKKPLAAFFLLFKLVLRIESNEGIKRSERQTNSRKKPKAKQKKNKQMFDAMKPKKSPKDLHKEFQEQNPDIKSMYDIGKACGEKWKTMTYELTSSIRTRLCCCCCKDEIVWGFIEPWVPQLQHLHLLIFIQINIELVFEVCFIEPWVSVVVEGVKFSRVDHGTVWFPARKAKHNLFGALESLQARSEVVEGIRSC